MALSPIALFTYNRPEHTKRTVEALQQNKLAAASDLFIFSDGPKMGVPDSRVAEVRKYLKGIRGFKTVQVIERDSNIGLSYNIIKGVQQVISSFGKVIVLEDDLLTSPFFLDFMNDGLDTYEEDDRVISIHGYVYPMPAKLPETFFLKGADCWGWATWKRGWDLFEPDGRILLENIEKSGQASVFNFDNSYPYTEMLRDQIEGKTNSWAVRWYASAFLKDKYTLYPGKSLVTNIGGDGSGTNVGFNHLLYNPFSSDPIKVTRQEVVQDRQAYEAFAAYHRKITRPSFWYKIKRRLKPIFK